jgi:hypothetical protein
MFRFGAAYPGEVCPAAVTRNDRVSAISHGKPKRNVYGHLAGRMQEIGGYPRLPRRHARVITMYGRVTGVTRPCAGASKRLCASDRYW